MPDNGSEQLREKGLLREAMETAIFAVALALLLRTFIVQAFYIPSRSMENTLLPGDMILVNKFVYYFKTPERGDIIVFKYPDPNPRAKPRDFIKRLIGLSLDTIEVKLGDVLINGRRRDEPYIKEKIKEDIAMRNPDGTTSGAVKVPENRLFVMGDNRNNSQDSRFWGFLERGRIKGRAMVIYWPPARIRVIR
jgi:signal peptidase I